MGRILQVICGCVLAVALGASAQQPPQAEQEPRQQDATARQQPPVGIVEQERNRERRTNQEEAQAEASPLDRADLTAQQAMAIFAGLQVVLTFFGLFFIYETLKSTREAVKDTGDATKAMIAANALAEEAQRGWVTVTVKKIGPIIRGHDQRVHVTIHYELENVGASPVTMGAHFPRVYHVAGHGPARAKDYFDMLESLRRSGLANTGLAPGEKLPAEPTVVVQESELIVTPEGLYSFQIWVGIAYRTRSFHGSSVKMILLLNAGGIPSRPGPWVIEETPHMVLGSSLT